MTMDPSDHSTATSESFTLSRTLRVPKRRVPARVVLADHTGHTGDLYVDILRSDGSPGRLLDRLVDSSEKYLPFAVEDSHVLLNKAGIVLVECAREEVDLPRGQGVKQLCVELRLMTGQAVSGEIHTFLPPIHSRVLDYLNAISPQFVATLRSQSVTLVNGDYIVGVTEILARAYG